MVGTGALVLERSVHALDRAERHGGSKFSPGAVTVDVMRHVMVAVAPELDDEQPGCQNYGLALLPRLVEVLDLLEHDWRGLIAALEALSVEGSAEAAPTCVVRLAVCHTSSGSGLRTRLPPLPSSISMNALSASARTRKAPSVIVSGSSL